MIAWTIKGEAGKTFDATVRSLEAAQIDSAQVAFKSLAEDTFTFSISPEAITSSTIPELKQSMTLYRDGVQFFHGTVTNVRNAINSESQQVQVTVSGPWWWMERIGFTTNLQDGMGNVSERLSAVFGSATTGQDLRTSIHSVIDRCAALGVPVATTAAGSACAAMTTFPRITLNQSTCGQVLSELVRLVPDTMVWFDYSVTPARMYVERRSGGAYTVTFNAATDPITSIDINPIIELQVSNVSLPYVTRSATGLTQFVNQESGSGPRETRQVLTISGPELDTYLPNFKYDTANITVVDRSSSQMLDIAKSNAGVANMPIGFGYYAANLWNIRQEFGEARYATLNAFSLPGNSLKNAQGTELNSTYKILTTASVPSWITTPVIDATLSGWIIWAQYRDNGYGTPSISIPNDYYSKTIGWSINTSGFVGNGAYPENRSIIIRANPFTMAVKATTATGGTVYAPSDYSFIFPPAGLAAFLQAAQSWLPYEGSINLVQEDVGGTRYRGKRIDISNSLPAFTSMGALVESEILDIINGSTTINLGCPPRNDYRTIVDKIRKTSQDNIVYV